jgi:hypothetical protein
LENEAFSLSAENPLSGIIQVGGTYVILFYEGRTKPIDTNYAEVKDLIHRDIHEKKLRAAMAKAFDHLKDSSHVDNFQSGEIKAAKRATPAPAPDPNPNVALPQVRKR